MQYRSDRIRNRKRFIFDRTFALARFRSRILGLPSQKDPSRWKLQLQMQRHRCVSRAFEITWEQTSCRSFWPSRLGSNSSAVCQSPSELQTRVPVRGVENTKMPSPNHFRAFSYFRPLSQALWFANSENSNSKFPCNVPLSQVLRGPFLYTLQTSGDQSHGHKAVAPSSSVQEHSPSDSWN